MRTTYTHWTTTETKKKDGAQMTHVYFFNIIIKWIVFVGRHTAHEHTIETEERSRSSSERDDCKLILCLVDNHTQPLDLFECIRVSRLALRQFVRFEWTELWCAAVQIARA